MIQIHLTQAEIELLRSMIDDYLEDLRVEIHATDNLDYKDMLKERKAVALKLQESLSEEHHLPLAD